MRISAISIRTTILVLALAAAAGPAAAGTFVPELLSSAHNSTNLQYTDIVIDPAGSPHVVYGVEHSGSGRAYIYYEWLDDGVWEYAQNHVGQYISQCAIDLDGSGVPHFAIHSGTYLGMGLRFISYDGGFWTISDPESGMPGSYSGGWPDLVIDSNDVPWISYRWKEYEAAPTAELRVAYRSGGTWYVETVDGGTDDVGEYTSIALSALERPRVSYYDRTNGNLMFARRSGTGVWTLELVDDLPDVGTWSSIAIGPDGNVHICYRNEVTEALRYARRNNNVWTTESIPDNHNTGDGLSIAVDDNGDPHISYYHTGRGRLRHIWKTGGTWYEEIVDDTDDRGLRSAIALAPDGTPHVTYVDDPDQRIWYATYEAAVAVPDGPPPVHALKAYPNPAGGGAPVRIEFAAAGGDKAEAYGPGSLGVYDVAGRRVRTLPADGTTRGVVQWDGRTDLGARAPAGTYLVRFEQGGRVVAERLQIVK